MNDRFQAPLSVAQWCAAKGIDEKAALRNLRALLARRQRHPGKLFIPGVADRDAYYDTADERFGRRHYTAEHAQADRALPTAEYIARFDQLNHLKPVTYAEL